MRTTMTTTDMNGERVRRAVDAAVGHEWTLYEAFLDVEHWIEGRRLTGTALTDDRPGLVRSLGRPAEGPLEA
jgi:hypothetical protein